MTVPASGVTAGGVTAGGTTESRLTLDHSIEVVAPHLPPALVAPDQLRRIRSLAALLPPVAVAGFECRLAGADQVDLAVHLPTWDRCFPLVAGHNPIHDLAPQLLADPAWQRVRRLCRGMRAPDGVLRGVVDDLWLEFDLPPSPDASREPGLFFSLGPPSDTPPRRYVEVAEAVLAELGAAPLSRAVRTMLLRAAGRLPQGAVIFQLGVPVAGPVDAVRLCLSGLRPAEIAGYLRAVGWDHEPAELSQTVAALSAHVDDLHLDIDVGRTVADRISLEAHLRGPKRPVLDHRWDELLAWLVGAGLCREEVRRGIAAWAGVSPVRLDGASGPAAQLAVPRLVGGRAALCFLRGLHHLKLSYRPDRGWEAKGYLGFKRHWTPTVAVRAAPPAPASPAPVSAGRRRRAPAGGAIRLRDEVSQALSAGVDFLVAARGPGGWWEDFNLASGASDTWVTAYVGRALADVAEPRAEGLARDAWRVVERRRDPSGGWGYSATVPPDADSTIWAVQLAERIADGAPSLAPARLDAPRAFLERHRRPGGGLATYADAAPIRAYMELPAFVSYRGWTSAHPCVTAAAANVRLLGDGPDELQAYLRRAQRSDGSWAAYWWADREYATALAVLGLGRRRPGPSPAHDQDRHEGDAALVLERAVGWLRARLVVLLDDRAGSNAPAAFGIAWCVRGLVGVGSRADQGDLIRAALQRLVATQLEDASWPASARLRVPPTDCLEPDRVERWNAGGRALRSVSVDRQRVFTTATVLSALSAGARCLAEPPA